MNENYDIDDTSAPAHRIEHPDFAPSRSLCTENVPHSEFILWGYKIIENGDKSRPSMLMPMYRVVSSDSSVTRLNINDRQQEASVSPLLLAPSSTSVSSSSTTSVIATSPPPPPPPLLPQSSSSVFPILNSSDNRDDAQKDETQSQQHPKSIRQQYSPEVTKYLKQAFVDTIGHDRKLTKSLRKKIMNETGLNSRSLTYWFSNRKRRPPFLAQQFKDSVKQSRGQVKTYEDFELWWALSKKKQ